MSQPESPDQRFERLAAQTERLVAPPGFAERMVSAAERAEPVPSSLWEVGRVALVAFAIAAAAAVAWSHSAQRQLDQNTLSAFDAVELEQ